MKHRTKNINTLHFQTIPHGSNINQSQNYIGQAGALDVHYNKLTIAFDGTKKDLLDTIAVFLNNQKEQGLITTEDLERRKNQ